MKKVFLISISLITFAACIRTNSTTPISAIQAAMNGKWQVDSAVTKYYDKNYADSVYSNHFVNISSSGNTVTIGMGAADIMTYTISDSLLTPYVKNSGIFAIAGCGSPLYPTKVSVSPNKLILLSNSSGFLTYTYMHR